MPTVLVYKTDISDPANAEAIVGALKRKCRDCSVFIDLQDCDNVLRVEKRNGEINETEIKEIVKNYGFYIDILR